MNKFSFRFLALAVLIANLHSPAVASDSVPDGLTATDPKGAPRKNSTSTWQCEVACTQRSGAKDEACRLRIKEERP